MNKKRKRYFLSKLIGAPFFWWICFINFYYNKILFFFSDKIITKLTKRKFANFRDVDQFDPQLETFPALEFEKTIQFLSKVWNYIFNFFSFGSCAGTSWDLGKTVLVLGGNSYFSNFVILILNSYMILD